TTTIVTSPSFSTIGMTSATLSLNEYFASYVGDVVVAIEYSTNGGGSWNTVLSHLGAGTGSTTWTVGTPNTTVALPAGALGQPTVMLRWNYNSTFGFYWAIDNVVVNGVG